MSPTTRLLWLSLAWLLLAALASAVPWLIRPWWILGGLIAIIGLADGILVWWGKPLDVTRRLPGRFAQGEPSEVRLVLRNERSRAAQVEVFDGIPQGALAPTMPWAGAVPTGREVRVFHPVTISQRGEAIFSRSKSANFPRWVCGRGNPATSRPSQ